MSLMRQTIIVIIYSVTIPLLIAIDFTFDFSGIYSRNSPMLMAGMLYFIHTIIPYFVLTFSSGNKNRNKIIACFAWTMALVIEPVYIQAGFSDMLISLFLPQLKIYDSMYTQISSLLDVSLILLYCVIALALIVGVSQKCKQYLD